MLLYYAGALHLRNSRIVTPKRCFPRAAFSADGSIPLASRLRKNWCRDLAQSIYATLDAALDITGSLRIGEMVGRVEIFSNVGDGSIGDLVPLG